jgi:hypothetical protein
MPGLRRLVQSRQDRTIGGEHGAEPNCQVYLGTVRHIVPEHACRGSIAAIAAPVIRGPADPINTTLFRRGCSSVHAAAPRW